MKCQLWKFKALCPRGHIPDQQGVPAVERGHVGNDLETRRSATRAAQQVGGRSMRWELALPTPRHSQCPEELGVGGTRVWGMFCISLSHHRPFNILWCSLLGLFHAQGTQLSSVWDEVCQPASRCGNSSSPTFTLLMQTDGPAWRLREVRLVLSPQSSCSPVLVDLIYFKPLDSFRKGPEKY